MRAKEAKTESEHRLPGVAMPNNPSYQAESQSNYEID